MNKPGGQKTFGTSISFDLDLPSSKGSRREKRTEVAEHVASEPAANPAEVDCPGCGATISQDEWIQSLVGHVWNFVTSRNDTEFVIDHCGRVAH